MKRQKPLFIAGLALLDVVSGKFSTRGVSLHWFVQHPGSEQLTTHKQAVLETFLLFPFISYLLLVPLTGHRAHYVGEVTVQVIVNTLHGWRIFGRGSLLELRPLGTRVHGEYI